MSAQQEEARNGPLIGPIPGTIGSIRRQFPRIHEALLKLREVIDRECNEESSHAIGWEECGRLRSGVNALEDILGALADLRQGQGAGG